jgi:hypothetical protein
MRPLLLPCVGATALLALSLLPAETASAATPGSWSTTAPEIVDIGGEQDHDLIGQGFAATDDRTPRFVVETAEASHVGATLVVREKGGRELCRSVRPVEPRGDVGTASCTAAVMPVARVEVEALLASSDGDTETQAAEVRLDIAPQQLRIEVVDVDPAADTATIAGNGTAGGQVLVGQPEGGMPFTWLAVPESGVWTHTVKHPGDSRFQASSPGPGLGRDGSTWFTTTGPGRPGVTVREDGGRTIVDVTTGADADRVEIRDRDSTLVAGGARTGAVTTLAIPTSSTATDYEVTAIRGDRRSISRWIAPGQGAEPTTVDLPVVERVSRSGDRLTVEVQALPGATVAISNAGGKVVALRMAGSTGRATVSLKAPGLVDDYSISQTLGGTTSDRDDIAVPLV